MPSWRLCDFALALLLLVASCASSLAAGQMAAPWKPEVELRDFAATSLGIAAADLRIEPADGVTIAVSQNGKAVGFIGSTWDIAATAGYSGRPIKILVLVDTRAVVRGTWLIDQQEPVLTLGIDPAQIEDFVNGFAGYDLAEPLQSAGQRKAGLPDAIAGATISSGVIRSGVIRTARAIAATHGLLPQAGSASIDTTLHRQLSWQDLVSKGALGRLAVSGADADAALGTAGGADAAGTFIEVYTAVLDAPAIGASLLGEAQYSSLIAGMGSRDHALVIAANGLYSFKGTSWRTTGTFERIEIDQAGRTIGFTRDTHRPLEKLEISGTPEFREFGIFVLPAASGFDPASPFRLSLIATREDAAGAAKIARFQLDYALPDEFLIRAPMTAPDPPLWQENWQKQIPGIAIVAAMLLALYLILIFQNQIAARPALYRAIRIGYLLATIVFLGLVFSVQLSVVHVLTFVQALRTDFSWETFLLDPLTFIVWGWVAVALLFWGRVYCGWLCPFGALQELLNHAAQRLGMKQLAIPFALHERLWPIKYIIFLSLFAASLASITLAFKGAEVEPFKTVVTLRFMREWPFVLYSIVLLAAGLFVERFFCRYLCPLGAAIAIPARLRMFEWLKRRPQCGRECRICATKCPVQAIHPEGHINPNECVYCLNCQTLYHDEHICPPLKIRAARRAAYAAKPGMEAPSP